MGVEHHRSDHTPLGEREALQILQRLLEVHVEPIDRVRPGEGLYDLEVWWPGPPSLGGRGEAETDGLSRAVLSALGQREYTVETELLRSRWVVGLLREASVKRIREELPEYLATVEAEGWTESPSDRLGAQDGTFLL